MNDQVTIDGTAYVAVGMPLDHGCEGCVGHDDDDLCGGILRQSDCGNDVREDGREVIWKLQVDA